MGTIWMWCGRFGGGDLKWWGSRKLEVVAAGLAKRSNEKPVT